MTTWTNMRINNMIEFSTNALRTHVTVRSVYGVYTQSVEEIRLKLLNNELLPPVRRMFQDMLDYWKSCGG